MKIKRMGFPVLALFLILGASCTRTPKGPIYHATTTPGAEVAPLFEYGKNSETEIRYKDYAYGKKMALFKRLDKNGDNAISFEEWHSFDKSRNARKHFNSLDDHKTGRVTLEDFLNTADNFSNFRESFANQDINKDQYLSQEEAHQEYESKIFGIHF